MAHIAPKLKTQLRYSSQGPVDGTDGFDFLEAFADNVCPGWKTLFNNNRWCRLIWNMGANPAREKKNSIYQKADFSPDATRQFVCLKIQEELSDLIVRGDHPDKVREHSELIGIATKTTTTW